MALIEPKGLEDDLAEEVIRGSDDCWKLRENKFDRMEEVPCTDISG